MKCQSSQDYNYAIDSSNRIIDVRKADRQQEYYCPCCRNLMVPHMGKIRKWHFAHKSGSLCNYETYLHKVAKARIREAFLTAEKFHVIFDPHHVCSIVCPLNKSSKCGAYLKRSFDIKKFYDVCQEETEYEGFRPDLILKSSTNPERPPIFIEINVTHKSTERKINSGHRIIEITIDGEGDIGNIVKNLSIIGHSIKSNHYDPKESKVVFFNFNKEFAKEPSELFFESKYVFALKDNGDFSTSHYHCYESIEEEYPSSEYSVIISSVSVNWLWAFAEFQRRGINVANCLRCKFYKHTAYGERICTLYKKYKTPKMPHIKQAKTCSYYKIATEDEDGTPIYKLAPSYNNESIVGIELSEPFCKIILHK